MCHDQELHARLDAFTATTLGLARRRATLRYEQELSVIEVESARVGVQTKRLSLSALHRAVAVKAEADAKLHDLQEEIEAHEAEIESFMMGYLFGEDAEMDFEGLLGAILGGILPDGMVIRGSMVIRA